MRDDEIPAELVAMLTEQEELLERTGAEAPHVLVEFRRQRREAFVRHADQLAEMLGVLGLASEVAGGGRRRGTSEPDAPGVP